MAKKENGKLSFFVAVTWLFIVVFHSLSLFLKNYRVKSWFCACFASKLWYAVFCNIHLLPGTSYALVMVGTKGWNICRRYKPCLKPVCCISLCWMKRERERENKRNHIQLFSSFLHSNASCATYKSIEGHGKNGQNHF